MHNKLASSFVLALALVGTMAFPAVADDSTFQGIVEFPLKVFGAATGTIVGVPLGACKDGVKGSIMATRWVADKVGDEDGKYERIFGAMVGGPFGLLGGGAYGTFDGAVHGMKTGYEKPFSKEAFTFKDE